MINPFNDWYMNNKKNLSIEIFNVKMLMVEEDFGYLGFVKGDLSLLPLESVWVPMQLTLSLSWAMDTLLV